MINEESFRALLQKIVEIHLPDEIEAFELGGNKIISDAMLSEKVTKQGDKIGAVDWGMVKTVLDIAVVAFSGWKVILEIRKLKKEEPEAPTLDDLQVSLVEMMVDGGIKKRKAKAISKDFFKELEPTIKK